MEKTTSVGAMVLMTTSSSLSAPTRLPSSRRETGAAPPRPSMGDVILVKWTLRRAMSAWALSRLHGLGERSRRP